MQELATTAHRLEVGGVSVEDVHVSRLDVDVLEEVVPHERVVALGVVARKVHVLVCTQHNNDASEMSVKECRASVGYVHS
jgi:hypothetical protein